MASFRGIIDFIIEMKTLVIELSGRLVQEENVKIRAIIS